MKIKTYAEGGGLIYTPFISEQSTFGNASSKSSESSDSEDSKLDPLDKELIALMKDRDLLPNEIEMIYNELISFQRSTQSLSSYSGLSGTDTYRSAMPGMLQIMSLLSQAKYNKGDYDEKWDEIRKHNAGSEVAMDSHGNMWVSEDGKIKRIRPNEYDEKKHYVLSNSEIMDLRRRSPELAFDNSLFTDTGMDVVGGEDVRKEIDDIINNFGSIKGSEFRKKAFKEIAADLQSGEGIFKITSEYSKADLTDFSGLLYSRLSAPAKHLVDANAAIGGYKPIEYIQTIIASETDRTVEESYEASMSKAAGMDDAESGSSRKTVKDTYAERLVSGDGISPSEWANIMTRNTGVTLHTYAQGAGFVLRPGEDGQKMPNASLHTVLTQANAIGAIVDSRSVTFGNDLIDPSEYKSLMVNNDVEMKRVWLPTIPAEDGRITPDFKTLAKLEELYKHDLTNITDAEIEAWLQENCPNVSWDSENKRIKFDQSTLRPFIVLAGVAGSNRVKFNKDSNYLYHDDKATGKRWQEDYDRIVREVTKSDKQGTRDAKGSSSGKFYEGNIYLPILSPTIGATVFNSQYYPQSTYTDITQKATNSELRRQVKTNF